MLRQLYRMTNNISKNQSQRHGFAFENSVRESVFGLSPISNDTNIHDIPCQLNCYDERENCSIKTTGSQTICCGDILRFYNYDFTEKNTIIVIKYAQLPTNKKVESIYEIDYNRECHKLLFGDLPQQVIQDYVEKVKSIPRNVSGKEAKSIFDYIEAKKQLQSYGHRIQINPKVDSKQSRVQCSIPNFTTLLQGFIKSHSTPEKPNLLRGHEIILSVESGIRQRKSKNVETSDPKA